MQEDNIRFEEIGKDETVHAEQSSTLFKQPVRGRYQNLHAELKAKCAPENFMNPYDPGKVSKANELYAEIIATDTQAEEKLKSFRLRAIEELGVKFSTEELYEKLTAACNPKNFTGDSYNKERLELANLFYQQILKNADNIFALEEIEKEAKEFVKDYKGGQQSQYESPPEELNELWVVFFFAVSFAILILLLTLNN